MCKMPISIQNYHSKKKINTVNNFITFSIVSTNKNGGGSILLLLQQQKSILGGSAVLSASWTIKRTIIRQRESNKEKSCSFI